MLLLRRVIFPQERNLLAVAIATQLGLPASGNASVSVASGNATSELPALSTPSKPLNILYHEQ
jgi:hypothetical protein